MRICATFWLFTTYLNIRSLKRNHYDICCIWTWVCNLIISGNSWRDRWLGLLVGFIDPFRFWTEVQCVASKGQNILNAGWKRLCRFVADSIIGTSVPPTKLNGSINSAYSITQWCCHIRFEFWITEIVSVVNPNVPLFSRLHFWRGQRTVTILLFSFDFRIMKVFVWSLRCPTTTHKTEKVVSVGPRSRRRQSINESANQSSVSPNHLLTTSS